MRNLGRHQRHCHCLYAAAILVVIGAGMAVMARAADVRDEPFATAGRVNHTITVREHAGWDRNCEAVAHPTLYLDEPPRHGSVCARAEDISIKSLYLGTESQCIGHRVRGVRLIYRPDAGFVGGDGLRYAVQYPAVRRSIAVTVTVAADQPATSGAEPSNISALPGPVRQDAGPVPPCTELMF